MTPNDLTRAATVASIPYTTPLTTSRHTIVNTSLGDQVASALRHEILSGALAPDEVLHQDALCSHFGTSRMPVRDALRQLSYEGFLVWSPNNQVRVATFTRPDVEDMFEVTAMLHGRLTRRATERCGEQDLAELLDLHEEMERCVSEGRVGELWERNRFFHRRIDVLAESPRLVAALRGVTIDLHRDALYLSEEQARQSNTEHHEILAAMTARIGTAAERLVAAHVSAARDAVISHLAESGVLRDR